MSEPIKIKITADATQAKKDLQNLQKDQTQNTPTNTQTQQISRIVAGYALNQGFSTITTALGNLEGQQRNAQRLSSIGGSAITTATAGFAIAGPIGAAVGAAVGGLTGAVTQLTGEMKATRDAINATNNAYTDTQRNYQNQRADKNFSLTLSYMTRQDQLQALQNRIKTLATDSPDSVATLRRSRISMIQAGQTDTQAYQDISKKYAEQLNRLFNHKNQLEDLRLQPLPTKLNPSDIADSYQKIGLTIGGGNANFQNINQDILTTIKTILEQIRKPTTPQTALMI